MPPNTTPSPATPSRESVPPRCSTTHRMNKSILMPDPISNPKHSKFSLLTPPMRNTILAEEPATLSGHGGVSFSVRASLLPCSSPANAACACGIRGCFLPQGRSSHQPFAWRLCADDGPPLATWDIPQAAICPTRLIRLATSGPSAGAVGQRRLLWD